MLRPIAFLALALALLAGKPLLAGELDSEYGPSSSAKPSILRTPTASKAAKGSVDVVAIGKEDRTRTVSLPNRHEVEVGEAATVAADSEAADSVAGSDEVAVSGVGLAGSAGSDEVASEVSVASAVVGSVASAVSQPFRRFQSLRLRWLRPVSVWGSEASGSSFGSPFGFGYPFGVGLGFGSPFGFGNGFGYGGFGGFGGFGGNGLCSCGLGGYGSFY